MSTTERERGSAVIEFALVVPVLLALVLGIAEFGRAYNISATLTGAARESVRVMALQNDVTAARTAAKNAAVPYTLTDAQIGVTPTTCTTDSSATVLITYPTPMLSGLFGTTITLHGKAVMRCNG